MKLLSVYFAISSRKELSNCGEKLQLLLYTGDFFVAQQVHSFLITAPLCRSGFSNPYVNIYLHRNYFDE